LPEAGNAGDKILSRIAKNATGGRAFFPFQITDVANGFRIQDELRSQYALSYKPAEFPRDGRFHTIEVLAQNKKGPPRFAPARLLRSRTIDGNGGYSSTPLPRSLASKKTFACHACDSG